MSTKRVLLLFIGLFISLCLICESGVASAASNKSLKLGVDDHLTDIEAVSVKDSYYVPLRDLAGELDLTLTGLLDGIEVKGQTRSLRLLKDNANAVLQDGSTISLGTFQQQGKLMVPLRLVAYLGFTISFKPEEYLLRVQDATAKLTDDAFVSQYSKDMKPAEPPAEAPEVASAKPGTTVFLTFDDGPSATTSQLLDILEQSDVKATFFMLGPHISSYPTQVKRITKDKYGVGLHGMTHRKEKFYASPAAALAEMQGDNAVLKKVTGVGTTLIRPPYGSKPYFTQSFRDKVLIQGYHLWDWNVDSEDWKYKEDSETIYNLVMNQVHKLKRANVNPVILMHDQKATLKVLPRILKSLKKEGYQFQIITNDLHPVNFWKDER